MATVAVFSLLGAGIAVVHWVELGNARGPEVFESLRLDFVAPADGGSDGPEAFDGSSAVPLAIAPEWQFTAWYERSSALPRDPEWHATVETHLLDASGRTAWSHNEGVAIDGGGSRGFVLVDMAHFVQEAERLAMVREAPGGFQVQVAVHHTSTMVLEHAQTPSIRTARVVVDVEPGGLAHTTFMDDRVTYLAPAESPAPIVAGGLAGVGTGAMLLGWGFRRRDAQAEARAGPR